MLTMLYRKLLTVVTTVRLRYAISIFLLLVAAYLAMVHPWMTTWGSTDSERQMVLPGDDLNPTPIGESNRAITINAPADVVWQWLVQVGQDRAGFYSYTWLENLVGSGIHNANEIRPEWQQRDAGDAWPLVRSDYLGGLGKEAAMPVVISEPGHALVIEGWGAFVIQPIDSQTSRLIVRDRPESANVVTRMVWDPVVFTMERRMLLGIKARAEGSPDAPPALHALAVIGWGTAGASVAALFLSQRRRRPWLVIPVLATLPALTSSDIHAALAAFIATGITLLGFLTFGRRWSGALLIIGSVVMLTLLLASDAYIAIGVAFGLILILTLAATLLIRHRETAQERRALVAQAA